MQLFGRQKKIIEILLSCTSNVSSLTLASKLNVSDRTVRSDIKAINEHFLPYGIKVISSKKGYTIFNAKNKDIFEIINAEEIIDSDERRKYILLKLMSAESYLSVESLANDLYVSNTTIMNDLVVINQIVAKFNLEIERKKHYGVKITGDEVEKRKYLSEIIETVLTKRDTYTEKIGYEGINYSNENRVKNIVEKCMSSLNSSNEVIDILNLTRHILIAIDRIKKGRYITLPDLSIKWIEETLEYELAKEMIETLENVYKIKFPKIELCYITMHLLCVKRIYLDCAVVDKMKSLLGEELIVLIENIFEEIDLRYAIDFSYDYELKYSLGMHLRAAMNRISFNFNIENENTFEIKVKYFEAFEIALFTAKKIQETKFLKINEDEIGFIALHYAVALQRLTNNVKKVAIICSSGIGSATLMKKSIEKEFDNIEVIGVFSAFILDFNLLKSCDLILSTIKINLPVEVKLLHVNALLSKRDICNINTILYSKDYNFNHFMESNYIQITSDNMKENVIKSIAQEMCFDSESESFFIKELLKRESLCSTDISKDIAIPHAILPGLEKTKLLFTILDKAVKWGENEVCIVFMLAINIKDETYGSDFFDRLYDFINEDKLIEKIKQTKDYELINEFFSKV